MGAEDGIGGVDPDMAEELMNQVDEDELEEAIPKLLNQQITPRLAEIRERAQASESRHQIRQQLRQLPEDEQTRVMMQAASDIGLVLQEIRQSPTAGLVKLKNRLRNPKTMEALLLIFEGDQVPDEWSDDRKEYATCVVRYVAMHLMPEAYTREEKEEICRMFHPDRDPVELLGPPPGENEEPGPGDTPSPR